MELNFMLRSASETASLCNAGLNSCPSWWFIPNY
jgi:hypothetical protein